MLLVLFLWDPWHRPRSWDIELRKGEAVDDIAWVVFIDTRKGTMDPIIQRNIILSPQLNATVFGIDEGKKMGYQCLGNIESIKFSYCRRQKICEFGCLGCDCVGAGIGTDKLEEVVLDLNGTQTGSDGARRRTIGLGW